MAQHEVKTESTVTYDDDVDVDTAYIYLMDRITSGAAVTQRIVEVSGVGEVILDFAEDDRLLGVEVLGASRLLPRELLGRLVPHP